MSDYCEQRIQVSSCYDATGVMSFTSWMIVAVLNDSVSTSRIKFKIPAAIRVVIINLIQNQSILLKVKKKFIWLHVCLFYLRYYQYNQRSRKGATTAKMLKPKIHHSKWKHRLNSDQLVKSTNFSHKDWTHLFFKTDYKNIP